MDYIKCDLKVLNNLGINCEVLSILDNNVNFKIITKFDINKETLVKRIDNKTGSIFIIKNNNLYFLIETDFINYKIYEIIKKEKTFINEEITILNMDGSYVINAIAYKNKDNKSYNSYAFDDVYENGEFKNDSLFLKESVISDKHKSKSDIKKLERIKKYF